MCQVYGFLGTGQVGKWLCDTYLISFLHNIYIVFTIYIQQNVYVYLCIYIHAVCLGLKQHLYKVSVRQDMKILVCTPFV